MPSLPVYQGSRGLAEEFRYTSIRDGMTNRNVPGGQWTLVSMNDLLYTLRVPAFRSAADEPGRLGWTHSPFEGVNARAGQGGNALEGVQRPAFVSGAQGVIKRYPVCTGWY